MRLVVQRGHNYLTGSGEVVRINSENYDIFCNSAEITRAWNKNGTVSKQPGMAVRNNDQLVEDLGLALVANLDDLKEGLQEACGHADEYRENDFHKIHLLLGSRVDVTATEIMQTNIPSYHKEFLVNSLKEILFGSEFSELDFDSLNELDDVVKKIALGEYKVMDHHQLWKYGDNLVVILNDLNYCLIISPDGKIDDGSEDYLWDVRNEGTFIKDFHFDTDEMPFSKKKVNIKLPKATFTSIRRALNDACDQADRYRANDYRLVKRLMGKKKHITITDLAKMNIPSDDADWVMHEIGLVPNVWNELDLEDTVKILPAVMAGKLPVDPQALQVWKRDGEPFIINHNYQLLSLRSCEYSDDSSSIDPTDSSWQYLGQLTSAQFLKLLK